MKYLPLPKHDDPDLDKYDLEPLFSHNLVVAKIDLLEAQRKIKHLKWACIALLMALSVAIGSGWGAYTTRQGPEKRWPVKEISEYVAHKWLMRQCQLIRHK